MVLQRMSTIFLLLLSLGFIASTTSVKDVCDGSSAVDVCSDDCNHVLDCSNSQPPLACAGVTSECHKPPGADAVCSVAPRCKGAPVLCVEAGQFPDVYFCTAYHVCPSAGISSEPMDCVTQAYNVATGECDLPLDNPVCQGTPVPECTVTGQSGALPGNPAFYYRCRIDPFVQGIIYPLMYMCRDSMVFDEDWDICR